MNASERHDLVVIPEGTPRMGVERSTAAQKVKAELDRKGYAVLDDAIPPALLERAVSEVRAVCERSPVDYEFGGVPVYGDRIRRAVNLVDKSPAIVEILGLPLMDTAAQAVMFESCGNVLLSTATAIEVSDLGDVPPQPLHRDEASYPDFLPRHAYGPEYTYNVLIAGTDFTAENGGTRLVPGSNLWPRGRLPTRDDPIDSLELSRGNVAVWVGSLYHGAGVNRTPNPRLGIILTFVAGWLRVGENPALRLDVERVLRLPPQVQRYLDWHDSEAATNTSRNLPRESTRAHSVDVGGADVPQRSLRMA